MTTKPLIGNFSSVGDTSWAKSDGTSLGNINATTDKFTFGKGGATTNVLSGSALIKSNVFVDSNSLVVTDQNTALELFADVGAFNNSKSMNCIVMRANSGTATTPGDFIKGYGGNGGTTLNFSVSSLGAVTASSFSDSRPAYSAQGTNFKSNIQGSVNFITNSVTRPTNSSKCLLTLTLCFKYTNSNGTGMTTGVIFTVKDGVTTVATSDAAFILVPSGFVNTLVRTVTFILDYPSAANFSLEAYEINSGGGSYSATDAFYNASLNSIRT